MSIKRPQRTLTTFAPLILSDDMTAAVKRWLYDGTEGFIALELH
jgi:hypothetical protein